MARLSGDLKLGFWAASASAALALFYSLAQIAEWLGWLGSQGGPNASSTAFGLALLLTPSLLLGPAFLAAIACMRSLVPIDRSGIALAALAFAAIYATLTGLVYFVQLTFVGPRLIEADTADIALLLFVPYESFLFAIDLLGYSFMSLATLFAAFALSSDVRASAARLALLANGLLLPFLALQMFIPALIWPAASWAFLFPLAMILLARLFLAIGVKG
ncbi:hypothetical protein [Altererythrobacter sp. GH1-8]|uniref:hypothetical protein n=1 Tax=Altererythrobacter sp. GH1-8 TaxID=3349333 RepID=UPI00374D4EE6